MLPAVRYIIHAMSKTDEIMAELEAERDRINQAIEALRNPHLRRMRTRRRGRLSAAARRRISLGMKKRWAERKKTQKAGKYFLLSLETV